MKRYGFLKCSTVWTPFVPKVLLVAENMAIRFIVGFDLSLVCENGKHVILYDENV